MSKLIKPARLAFMIIFTASLLALYAAALYKIQIVDGASYLEESKNTNISEKMVVAARGDVKDRYGRVLVSNRECYNLLFNTNGLFELEDPNRAILQIIDIVEECGDRHTDDLPVTKGPPYEYTNMTDLQRTQLTAYFERHELAEDTTAVELMSYFRRRYDIDNNYSAAEMRTIAGVRYSINMRYALMTTDYVFVEDASVELISKLVEFARGVFTVDTSFIREYHTQYAAHILGYVGLMNDSQMTKYLRQGYSKNAKVGHAGVELAFEDYLHGIDGKAQITSTAAGTVISTVYTTEPQPGNHVYLTIDSQFQEGVERELDAGHARLQAARDANNLRAISLGAYDEVREDIGPLSACVVDVKSGEPLVIASYPTFSLATRSEDWEALMEDEEQPLFNRALMGTYAPGSTFKLCTAITALATGEINTETRIDCLGVFDRYAVEGYAPMCWIYQDNLIYTHGNDNISEAIRDSCNYFFFTVGHELGVDKMGEYAHKFGLGVSTGIELPEETGNMANRETHYKYDVDDWVIGDTLQAAIGQSDSLFTPLQLAEYCAVVANGGTRYSASILKEVRSYDYSSKLYENENEVLSTIETSQFNWAAVRHGMYLVAYDSNSSLFPNLFTDFPVKVGVKTGTAQLGEDKTNNGIFICFAPYDDPEIAIAVVGEHVGSGSSLKDTVMGILNVWLTIKNATSTDIRENTLLK